MSRPQLCDIFEHNGSTYRVDGFMKWVEFPFQGKDDPDPKKRFTYMALVQLHGKTSVRRQVWCTAEEAEFVTGCGVGGTIAPISEVKVTGRVSWDEATIAEQVKMYNDCYVGEIFYS